MSIDLDVTRLADVLSDGSLAFKRPVNLELFVNSTIGETSRGYGEEYAGNFHAFGRYVKDKLLEIYNARNDRSLVFRLFENRFARLGIAGFGGLLVGGFINIWLADFSIDYNPLSVAFGVTVGGVTFEVLRHSLRDMVNEEINQYELTMLQNLEALRESAKRVFFSPEQYIL